MEPMLRGIAEALRDADKKVQLIYAFNGVGKTRLSKTFKELIAPSGENGELPDGGGLARDRILYYNAFTEDLFYWDNDLENDLEPKLTIQPNTFTDWVLLDQGQDQNVIDNFQKLANQRLTPAFNQSYRIIDRRRVQYVSHVTFSMETGDDETTDNIKISKGEESNFIWSVFFTLLQQIVAVLDVPDPDDRETDKFDRLQYVFIDDPVSSLDDNHLIALAANLATLIKSSRSTDLKFIITTHNPLFYNILYNEFGARDQSSGYRPKHAKKYLLDRKRDGSLQLDEQPNDSPFSYHLLLLQELNAAIESGEIQKYHFNFLRNILEKTATFLGHRKWGDLLPPTDDGTPDTYATRIINLCSHSAHSGEEAAIIEDDDKRVLGFLVRRMIQDYSFKSHETIENG
ncbi:MAG: anticodon nuclease [Henriciella sp.]|uniref:AAA family ATPase n=1 Tax=uncultured Henriciella sp. TaxID=1608424 RepID=UPI000C5AE40B|nr:anticodon nuclease [Henriciella sp.]MBF35572.1 anticodon nuclease [Hyphomonadaceae bacterium]|tara:strand:+ start:6458 stop:7660 length:1203 start_codon:yes stop_codon:yes gene_type:complete